MKLFNVTPYLLLLEQENSNEETLSKANAEFVKEVYELQRAENDITIVLFQLQYLSVTRNFAASLFRNIKYFTLRKLYLCRKWMQKRLQKTTTTGITLPNFDFLA